MDVGNISKDNARRGTFVLSRGFMCNYCMHYYFSARRPSGAKIIACSNFSAWFRVQLLRVIILESGRRYRCQSVSVTSLQKCRLTKNYCYYQPLRQQRRFISSAN